MKTAHVLDFETASGANLKVAGPWAYAEHPTTEVLCLSFEYSDDRGPIKTWSPLGKYRDKDISPMLWELANDPDVIFVSHGDFERAMWTTIMVPEYGFPEIPIERWQDTMAVCAMKQLPLKLELALDVLGGPEKDIEGSRFTVALSKPNRKTGMLDRSPESIDRASRYCETDVAIERWLLNRVGRLQPCERPVWELDQKINRRGVRLDISYINACMRVVAGATKPLVEEFREITGGLQPTQRDRIMDWLEVQAPGMVPDLKKPTIEALIGKGIEDDDDDEPVSDGATDLPVGGSELARSGTLPLSVRRALQIRQTVGSASVKKLPRMLACISGDGAARGLLQYHRAGPGRWAGRLLQPQNFPRPSLKDEHDKLLDPDVLVAALMTGDYEWVEMMLGHDAIACVVSGLRHTLIARPGKVFMSGDYSQIEARIVLALAGQYDKCDLFARIGSAIYIDMACDIFKLPKPDFTDKKAVKEWKENHPLEYTIGKNTILGAGFGMGAGTFFNRYCPTQSLEFAAKAVRAYRKDFAPKVPYLWYGLEKAAVDTVWSGNPHSYAGCEYRLEDGFLTCRLPSGRKIYYWRPTKIKAIAPWTDDEGRPVYKPNFTYEALKMGHWQTCYIHGGLLAENVVQALARDQLVHAMFLLEDNNYPTVLTVHDEDVVEVDEWAVDEKGFYQIMSERPAWAHEIKVPIAVEGWVGERYRK